MIKARIGKLGALVEVYSTPDGHSVSQERDSSTRTTLGGRKVVRLAARGHRTWSFSGSGGKPLELAALQGFARGDFGPGPFWWVDPWAQQSNLLDPRDAAIEVPWGNSTLGGPVVLPGGPVVARHVRTASASTLWSTSPFGDYSRAPVVPGRDVTLSAWVDASTQGLRYVFHDAAGAVVGGVGVVSGTASGWHRVSRTLPAPVGAASVVIGQSGTGGLAAPAVTWTSEVREYGTGAGARKVIVTGYSESVKVARRGAMYSDQSYQIVEVG